MALSELINRCTNSAPILLISYEPSHQLTWIHVELGVSCFTEDSTDSAMPSVSNTFSTGFDSIARVGSDSSCPTLLLVILQRLTCLITNVSDNSWPTPLLRMFLAALLSAFSRWPQHWQINSLCVWRLSGCVCLQTEHAKGCLNYGIGNYVHSHCICSTCSDNAKSAEKTLIRHRAKHSFDLLI